MANMAMPITPLLSFSISDAGSFVEPLPEGWFQMSSREQIQWLQGDDVQVAPDLSECSMYFEQAYYSNPNAWVEIVKSNLKIGELVDVTDPKNLKSAHCFGFTGKVVALSEKGVQVSDSSGDLWDIAFDEIASFSA